MGCCCSKKRMKHPDGSAAVPRRYKPEDRDPPPPPSPEEEKVKEVLSETPSTKVAAEPKPVANVVTVEEEEVLKVKASVDPVPAVSDLGSCLSMATDERSEAASESSVATSSLAGPERSPGRPARKRAVSGELGLVRRDRAVAAATYGVRSRSCRGSPSPPPRRDPRDRSVRRSPSPAAKRASPEQHRAASPVASLQRKPPVPSSRASPRRAREAPPPLSPPPQPEDDAVTTAGEESVAEPNAGADGQGDGDGEGKESLENPLVSMECFIFL
ncbi:uncharacterized protein [Aegilops tauschii subsp. strangulata]|uniref:Uncharacterized protein n=1 Tax=Aegilops tauschii subsp. strangulata TaxID=200361 RepID=A0A453FP45_AEGTS|nr:serine/arginine repetitive matrix protein 1 [Aegilops tauschii subsp. strangulata]